MIRTINDFLDRWKYESDATLKIFNNLTDESLQIAIPDRRTLGRLANHIVETLTEMPQHMGLPIKEEFINYTSVQELINNYKKNADQVAAAVLGNWNDDILEEERNMYGMPWKNGISLWALILHQTHHRAQMTVLMHMAGLNVPGIYGPSKQEWVAWGKTPLE